MEATIVTLGPSDKLVGVCTFEEAFGEHSEFRGRGRARRHKRKMDRIKNRREEKAARQEIRKDQQEARQERKDTRKTRKVARKAIGDEEDGEEDPDSVNQQDTYDNSIAQKEDQSTDDQSSDDQGSEDDAPEPYDFENGSGADGEDYAEARGGRRGRGGRGKRGGLGSRMRARRAERKAAPVEEVQESETEEVERIDGDFMDGETLSAATGTPVRKIHPQIRDTTKRIVWNKEALRRHRGNHAQNSKVYAEKMKTPMFRSQPNHPQVLGLREAIQRDAMEIQKHEERLSALERTLAQNFSGHPHIEHGYKLANIDLQKQIEASRNGQAQTSIKDTLVDKGLGAEIGSERIDVPAQPEMRTIELSSNASGDASKGMSTPTKLLIGVAALGVAYYFAKKYKVI